MLDIHLRFSTTSDGTHGGGSEYTTGVTTAGTPGSIWCLYTNCCGCLCSKLCIITVLFIVEWEDSANTNSTLGSSNFDGSVQSTVKANATAGFSIVKWTGNGSSIITIGHGLGVAPKLIITKETQFKWKLVDSLCNASLVQ